MVLIAISDLSLAELDLCSGIAVLLRRDRSQTEPSLRARHTLKSLHRLRSDFSDERSMARNDSQPVRLMIPVPLGGSGRRSSGPQMLGEPRSPWQTAADGTAILGHSSLSDRAESCRR